MYNSCQQLVAEKCVGWDISCAVSRGNMKIIELLGIKNVYIEEYFLLELALPAAIKIGRVDIIKHLLYCGIMWTSLDKMYAIGSHITEISQLIPLEKNK